MCQFTKQKSTADCKENIYVASAVVDQTAHEYIAHLAQHTSTQAYVHAHAQQQAVGGRPPQYAPAQACKW